MTTGSELPNPWLVTDELSLHVCVNWTLVQLFLKTRVFTPRLSHGNTTMRAPSATRHYVIYKLSAQGCLWTRDTCVTAFSGTRPRLRSILCAKLMESNCRYQVSDRIILFYGNKTVRKIIYAAEDFEEHLLIVFFFSTKIFKKYSKAFDSFIMI